MEFESAELAAKAIKEVLTARSDGQWRRTSESAVNRGKVIELHHKHKRGKKERGKMHEEGREENTILCSLCSCIFLFFMQCNGLRLFGRSVALDWSLPKSAYEKRNQAR